MQTPQPLRNTFRAPVSPNSHRSNRYRPLPPTKRNTFRTNPGPFSRGRIETIGRCLGLLAFLLGVLALLNLLG